MVRARLGLALLLVLAACQLFGVDSSFPDRHLATDAPQILPWAVVLAVATGAALSFVRARGRQMRECRRTALAEANLDALRFQLRPHFLFNTLHTLLPLVEKDPDRARTMVVRLGDLLRSSLRAEERPFVTLGEEVAILESYLAIEQVRFRDRLDVSLRIEPEAAAAEVPCFLLQPLVENALEGVGVGRIAVTARIAGSELAIAVGNEGVVLGVLAPSADAGGPGLRHTRRRLEAIYPGRYRLDFLDAPAGGAEVRLSIPLAWSSSPAAIPRAS